jgi:tRNA modification GTPase
MHTIFALSTPPGKSGVAIIRISGEQAIEALAALHVRLPSPRVATLASLMFDGIVIDRALVIYFPAPHSFTGEDIIELHIHGSRAVIGKILGIFSNLPNLRPAEPGEFTRRAFLGDKMDLTSVEGLADLIDAETEAQRKQALRHMQGEAAVFFTSLRSGILHALAYLEAYIDFPDEDIPEHVLQEIQDELQSIAGTIEWQLADKHISEKIRDGITIAILGPPNVGKSSLMNLLTKRDVAIVSEIAGTTRDVIEVHLDIKGYAVILADTAGIREQTDAVEGEGIRRSFIRAEEADINIILLDKESDYSGLTSLIDETTLVILNKCDEGIPSSLPVIHGHIPIPISVRNILGIDSLMDALEMRIGTITASESSYITRARHRVHLTQGLEHIKIYLESSELGLELRAEHLRRAATEIGHITGHIAVDELLGHIFGSFCIGK